jgi:thioredoxin-related protein
MPIDMLRTTLTISTLLAISPALLAQDHEKTHADLWHADFDKAAAAAKEAGKDLLVDFTGSDWCGWCHKLDDEVFSHDEFIEGVKDHFILVALDFPRAEAIKAKVPNPERNQALMEKYGVQGFPTVLAMTSDGTVYGRTGYEQGGPENYLANLDKMRTEAKPRVMALEERVAKFEKAEGEERTKMIKAATSELAAMTGEDIGVDRLADIVRAGVSSEDTAVRDAAVVALLKSGQAGDAEIALVDEIDPKNEQGLHDIALQARMQNVRDEESCRAYLDALDKLLAVGPKNMDEMTMPLVQAVAWSLQNLGDKERAVKYAKVLQPLVDKMEDDQMKPRIQQLIKMVLDQ